MGSRKEKKYDGQTCTKEGNEAISETRVARGRRRKGLTSGGTKGNRVEKGVLWRGRERLDAGEKKSLINVVIKKGGKRPFFQEGGGPGERDLQLRGKISRSVESREASAEGKTDWPSAENKKKFLDGEKRKREAVVPKGRKKETRFVTNTPRIDGVFAGERRELRSTQKRKMIGRKGRLAQ